MAGLFTSHLEVQVLRIRTGRHAQPDKAAGAGKTALARRLVGIYLRRGGRVGGAGPRWGASSSSVVVKARRERATGRTQ